MTVATSHKPLWNPTRVINLTVDTVYCNITVQSLADISSDNVINFIIKLLRLPPFICLS